MAQVYPGVAAVTGAASGIGRATCLEFAELGCSKFALLDRNKAGLEETKSLITKILSEKEPDIIVVEIDVTSPESVTTAYSTIKSHFQRIDYSVQCAGLGAPSVDSASTSLETFDLQHAVNCRGLWLCARETIKIMQNQSLDTEAYPNAKIAPRRAQRGSIVNIASTLAIYAQPLTAAYCAAKGGVLALTRADAMDCVKYKIRVNCVMPGLVDTPMTNPDPALRQWLEETVVSRVPIGRIGQPEEVADVCVYLSSNKASYVTGQGWAVDGGLLGGSA